MTLRSDIPQGTLDLLILKVVALGPLHGYGIAQRLQQLSRDVVQVQQGSLYPALHRLENRGLLVGRVGRVRYRVVTRSSTGSPTRRTPGARRGRGKLASAERGDRTDPRARGRRAPMTWLSRLLGRCTRGIGSRSRAARSRRAACRGARRLDGRPGGRRAAPRRARVRRDRADQGRLSRCAGHTVGARSRAGRALRRPRRSRTRARSPRSRSSRSRSGSARTPRSSRS